MELAESEWDLDAGQFFPMRHRGQPELALPQEPLLRRDQEGHQ